MFAKRRRTVIAGALVAALVLSAFLVRRGPASRLPGSAEISDSRVEQNASSLGGTARPTADGNAATQRAASEVRAMSPTFRNSTFLIAIRRSGYYCDDVVSASESADGGWVASCRDKGGYTISVRAIDEFDVRPIGHYLDGITPALIPSDLDRR
jgi:hypothetical protein